MTTPLFQVDAFADAAFTGNPAAVCLLDAPREAPWMQRVAAEMNLSETAFVAARGDGAFDLRWFTPAVEVPLCGHATLASAHVLFETGRAAGEARFHTRSGVLGARRRDAGVEIDLPAYPVEEVTLREAAATALGVAARFAGRTPERGLEDRDLLVEVASETEVRRAAPDFAALAAVGKAGWIVTAAAAAGAPYDYVSRYFAPAYGIDEDPVTGAAHCSLVPFWSRRLGRAEVVGYQASARGGTVRGRLADGRALLTGGAVTVLRGELLA